MICKRVKAFTSCTAVQAQGHSGRRSTGFLLARYVNTDFSRISRQMKILRSRASSMTLSDLEQLDQASQSLIAGQSQSF